MLIATFNVNGIRAASRRGFTAWLTQRTPAVLALQEVRCSVDALPDGVFGDYHVSYDPGTLAGRNGVALLTQAEPAAVRYGIRVEEFAHEGRYIEADLAEAPVTVASLYLPKGATRDVDEAKYERKMRFMAGLATYISQAAAAAKASGREYVIMGDFNIAHQNLDLKNWKANQKNEGFLPEERAWFSDLLAAGDVVDVVRSVHPDESGPYSWWSWRGKAFDNDAGWRIDYQLATPGLAKTAVAAGTDREDSYDARLSDHAPVVVDYSF